MIFMSFESKGSHVINLLQRLWVAYVMISDFSLGKNPKHSSKEFLAHS